MHSGNDRIRRWVSFLPFTYAKADLDRIDNGINISTEKPNYALRTDLSSRIKRVNPHWNEPADDTIYDVCLTISDFIGHPSLVSPRPLRDSC